MHCWMIEWCSKKLTAGNGFLELGNATTGMDIDVEAEYPLTEKKLYHFGMVPLRRSGHPEFEFADGSYYDSSEIQKDECFRLQIANASGEDLLPDGLQQVRAANPTMDQAGYPNINQLKVVLSKDTPLDLEVCKARKTKKGDLVLIPGTKKPVPDLCGNLSAVLMCTEGMYLIETHWPGKRLGHLLLFDAERNYLMMGRCGETLKQTTLIPTADDCLNPMERLKDEYGFEFTVGDVALIMLNTRKMSQIPLAAYDLGPALERKAQKLKIYKAQEMKVALENTATKVAPPAKKMKVASSPLQDMTTEELQAVYKAKLGRTQVRGPSARNKEWLIDKINGGMTIRAKRAQKQGGSPNKRARN